MGFERLCLSFATQTPIMFGFAEVGSNPDIQFQLKKKRHPKGYLFFFGGEHGIRKALPFVCYANTDYVRLRRGGFESRQITSTKKEKDTLKGIFSFLAESMGFEPTKRFWPFTRFPIVLLRPARTTLHTVQIKLRYKIPRSFQSALLL